MNILFICTLNRMRSLTAHKIFEEDTRFEVKSAGTAAEATSRIDKENLAWADYIIVMEKAHRNRIRAEFPEVYKHKRIICMYIADEYDFMDDELVRLLRGKFEFLWNTEIELDWRALGKDRKRFEK